MSKLLTIQKMLNWQDLFKQIKQFEQCPIQDFFATIYFGKVKGLLCFLGIESLLTSFNKNNA